MNKGLIIIAAGGIVAVTLIVLAILLWLKARRIKPEIYKQKWLEIQRLCASKETWRLAVVNADKLLETALKQKHFKGKSMGERMVAAQRILTDNDAVWYAHNLAKKLIGDKKVTLREAEAKKSLVGIRQALRDLGVLNGK